MLIIRIASIYVTASIYVSSYSELPLHLCPHTSRTTSVCVLIHVSSYFELLRYIYISSSSSYLSIATSVYVSSYSELYLCVCPHTPECLSITTSIYVSSYSELPLRVLILLSTSLWLPLFMCPHTLNYLYVSSYS